MSTTTTLNRFLGGKSTIVGLLACQINSYQKSIDTTVVSCTPTPKKQYELELEDTVLFPEGGGQPSDLGTLKLDSQVEIPVLGVRRDGFKALHLVPVPIDPGTKITAEVDWAVRLDHMQQHTGQHLLSAILDKRNANTASWSMGSLINYVELTRKLTDEEIEEVQSELNTIISEDLPITVTQANDVPDPEKGVIRVISIDGIDENPCCGTHLQSTSAIHALALLHQVPIRGTNSRLHFVAGHKRLATFARNANATIRSANSALSCQTEEITDKISKLNLQIKDLRTGVKYWSTANAQQVVEQINDKFSAESTVYLLIEPKADANYFKTLEKELKSPINGTLILAGGEIGESGPVIVLGNNVAEISAKIVELIPGIRGGGKAKWQGKVVKWEKSYVSALQAEFGADIS